jgi:hypothetical protein
MLTPHGILDTIIAKHDVATSDDIIKLRELLSRAVTSLSDLANHMDLFLLANQHLTRSGQGMGEGLPLFRTPFPRNGVRLSRTRAQPATCSSTAEPGYAFPVFRKIARPPVLRPPRDFYCWLYGWNKYQHGVVCKIMRANQACIPAMKNARNDAGAGGNPKIGVPVPVSYSRPHKFPFPLPRASLVFLSLCTPFHHLPRPSAWLPALDTLPTPILGPLSCQLSLPCPIKTFKHPPAYAPV